MILSCDEELGLKKYKDLASENFSSGLYEISMYLFFDPLPLFKSLLDGF